MALLFMAGSLLFIFGPENRFCRFHINKSICLRFGKFVLFSYAFVLDRELQYLSLKHEKTKIGSSAAEDIPEIKEKIL